MKIFRFLLPVCALLTCAAHARTAPADAPPTPADAPSAPALRAPAPCDNTVVAHRGGSLEAGIDRYPDNSLASLEYAMNLRCYASECDIYWTRDNRVVVAHAELDGTINGLYPWEATLDELRAAGTLSNGEQLPALEEYIDRVMTEGSCTRLWIDIKKIIAPEAYPQYAVAACRRACEIIAAKRAQNFCEFICSSSIDIMLPSAEYAAAAGIGFGWMAGCPVDEYLRRGLAWANLSVVHMDDGVNGGKRTIREFTDRGIAFSVYTADSDGEMEYYASQAGLMKAVCTNYPARMLAKLGVARE